MKTIKTKLFLIFMILMVSLVLSGILLNSIFLESYYIYKNKGTFVSVSKKISDEYINNKENSNEYINMVNSIDGISTTIVDQNFNVEFTSINQKSNINEKRVSKEIKQLILDNEKKISNKYIYDIEEKNNT